MYKKLIVLIFFVVLLFVEISVQAKPILEIYKTDTEESIKKSLLYFKNRDTLFNSKFLLYVYERLQQHYSFASAVKLNELITRPTIYDDEKADLKYLERIRNKHYFIDSISIQELGGKADITYAMYWALYSDKLPVTASALSVFKALSLDSNPRTILHVLLAEKWYRELHPGKRIFDTAQQHFMLMNLMNFISLNPYFSDDKAETILGVLFFEKLDLMKTEWVSEIIKSQQPNGGWKWNAEAKESNDHTTLLCLWLLQAIKNPEHANMVWLPE